MATASAGAIALIGAMASGKSAVGRVVAERLGMPLVDTDVAIEAQAGPIAEIFAHHGEAAFRRLERDVAVAAIASAEREPCVLALGGGAVLSGDVLWARVQASTPGTRPLARDQASFMRLVQERDAFYRSCATVEVRNDGSRDLSDVADTVVALVGFAGTAQTERSATQATSSVQGPDEPDVAAGRTVGPGTARVESRGPGEPGTEGKVRRA